MSSTGYTWETSGGVELSTATPQAIGTAAAGSGTSAAKDDHVHADKTVGTPGTYAYPTSITTDAGGRISSITAGSAPAAGGLAVFGDGSDGDVTISGGTTTLSREMCYNNLTITGTGILDMNGWPVRVKGTLTIQASGRMHCDGYAASGSTGGLARPDNYLGGSTAGSNGSASNASGASSITNSAGGGAGGNGGSGSGGAYFGGSGGTRSLLSSIYGSYRAAPIALQQYCYSGTSALMRGGTGGGGGAGNGGEKGGGGGSGGGRALVCAKTLTILGTLSCNGSNGVNATNTNTGGGGGGGGGSMTVCYQSLTGTPTCTGGAAGTGNGNGGAGSAGADGTVIYLQA